MSAPAAEPDLRLILDNIPGLFGLLNAEGRLQFLNRQILDRAFRFAIPAATSLAGAC